MVCNYKNAVAESNKFLKNNHQEIFSGYDEDGVAIPAKPIYPDGPIEPTSAPAKEELDFHSNQY